MQEVTHDPAGEPPAQAGGTPALGHYILLREAGRGAVSTVYEAEDTRGGRRVAVKVVAIPAYMSPARREALIVRLQREARAIARMSHPNIVTLHDVGEQDGRHFLVMEYLDGITLRTRLEAGPLPVAEIEPILSQIAAGLGAVHSQGIVHRDLKPSNVMLLPDGRVKLMDFGIARAGDDTMVTQAGMLVGSPDYMAPEQVRGEEATAASDCWALGALLYEMLSGRPPFTSENLPSVLYRVVHDAPPPLAAADVSVQRVIARALAKEQDRRFPSAPALAEAFREAQSAPAPPPDQVPPPPAIRAATRPAAARRRSPRDPHSLVWLASVLLPAVLAGAFLRPQLPASRPRATPVQPARREVAIADPVSVQLAAPPALRPAAPEEAREPPPAAPRFASSARRAPGPALVGAWHGWQGIHGRDPATLTIGNRRGDAFDGVLVVQTPERATVRVAISGRLLPDRRVTMRETRILSSTKPRVWDLGRKSGQLGSDGKMSGIDHDIRGRTARWWFSR